MIRVRTNGPSGLDYAAWYEKAVKHRTKAIAFWKNCRKSSTSPGVWSAARKVKERGEKPQEIWDELKIIFLHKIFNHKCAYCEGRYDAGYAWHVEHYRPKSEVTEDRKVIEHPGYFWLTHEWYNLLLSCGHCNTWEERSEKTEGKSDPSKSNEFRVKGNRITEPGPDTTHWCDELKEEQPLLLNPYFDDPEEHLGFDEFGQIYGKTERGRETVMVCNLRRQRLVEARIRSKDRVFRRIIEQLDRADNGEGPPAQYFGPEEEFSAWLNHWAGVLTHRLCPGNQQPSGPVPATVPAPNPAGPQVWPKDMVAQAQAALGAFKQHPQGLTPAQLVRCFRRPQNVRILELLDLLVSLGKVRVDSTGRYISDLAP